MEIKTLIKKTVEVNATEYVLVQCEINDKLQFFFFPSRKLEFSDKDGDFFVFGDNQLAGYEVSIDLAMALDRA